MRTSLVGLLIAGLAFVGYGSLTASTSGPTSWTAVTLTAQRSVVRLSNGVTGDGEKVCAGSIINVQRKLVLTAAHCEPANWVEGLASTVVAKDSELDLLVREVPLLDGLPVLELADADPQVQQTLVVIGYAYGWKRLSSRRMHVSDPQAYDPTEGGPYINMDSALIGGMSGGPLIDASGKMVGMGTKTSQTDAFAIPASRIRQRFDKLWSLK